MRFRTSVIAALLVALGVMAAQAADEWQSFRSPEDRFAADFPKAPAPQPQKFDPQQQVRSVQFWADLGDIAFGVSASQYHPGILTAQTPAKQIDGVIERVGGSLQ